MEALPRRGSSAAGDLVIPDGQGEARLLFRTFGRQHMGMETSTWAWRRRHGHGSDKGQWQKASWSLLPRVPTQCDDRRA
ncbi:hypothetical protein HYQ46_009713 [Verticillium longisporum]|nr:hypothetical protein HYQ46_009713 [Verticillium longisporum]